MGINLDDVGGGYTAGTINNNFNTIKSWIQSNLLHRDGLQSWENNSMEAELDMNSNTIVNLPAPTAPTHPVRLQDIDSTYLTGTGTPEGVVTAAVGILYTRTDGGTGTTLYVKESGSGSTGWAAK